MKKLIDGALCVALPAIWCENMPNAILEACAHGKPSVVSRIGSMTEMVDEGVTGLLCEPGDPDSLAEKLQALCDDKELAGRMGRAARKRCETLYAPDSYYRRLMEVFEEAIANAKGRKGGSV